jgi:hypothetical protein
MPFEKGIATLKKRAIAFCLSKTGLRFAFQTKIMDYFLR